MKPIAAQPTVRNRSASPAGCTSRARGTDRSGGENQQPTHGRRPLLDDVARRAFLADLLPDPGATQPLDKGWADHDGEHHRDEAGDQDSDHALARFSIEAGMPSSPTAREALTRIASPGWRRLGDVVECAASGIQRREAVLAPEVGTGTLADRDHELDAELVEQGANLLVVAGAASPSSAISPRIATRRRSPARAASSTRAATIDVGLALYASLTTMPPPGSGDSSPRQRESVIASHPPGHSPAEGPGPRTPSARPGCSPPCGAP